MAGLQVQADAVVEGEALAAGVGHCVARPGGPQQLLVLQPRRSRAGLPLSAAPVRLNVLPRPLGRPSDVERLEPTCSAAQTVRDGGRPLPIAGQRAGLGVSRQVILNKAGSGTSVQGARGLCGTAEAVLGNCLQRPAAEPADGGRAPPGTPAALRAGRAPGRGTGGGRSCATVNEDASGARLQPAPVLLSRWWGNEPLPGSAGPQSHLIHHKPLLPGRFCTVQRGAAAPPAPACARLAKLSARRIL